MSNRSQPRRPRWGLLILGLALVLMLFAIGFHQLWSVGAGRRLAKLVATYRAAGQPIEPDDFATYAVSTGPNAVPDLRAAAAALDQSSELWKSFVDDRDDATLALRPEEITVFRGVVAANAEVLALLESASAKGGVNWNLQFRTPVITVMLPDLNYQRLFARLLRADALLAHTDGDHARALRRAREMLFLGRAVGKQPILVSHLVSVGIDALTTSTLIDMAEDLRVGTGAGEATPQQVRELIAALLDETDLAASQRDALLGERMMQLDVARGVAAGKLSPNGSPAANTAVAGVVKPTALDDGVLMLRHTTKVIEASAASPDWPAFQRAAPVFPSEVRERPWRHMVAATFMPALDRAVQTHYRMIADRRSAAVVLALRLYAVDHGGELPPALDGLVPRYLAVVPLDPMASGQPLKYVAGPDPLVYSVGEDGADDGGSELAKANYKTDHPDKWHSLDAVSHYKRQPRRAPEPPMDDGVGGFNMEPQPATLPATGPVSP